MCSVFVYVDLYADVNLTEVLILDTKDWNVLFLFPLTDFYMYIVFMWFIVLNVVGLYLFYLCISFSLSGYFFIKLLELSWIITLFEICGYTAYLLIAYLMSKCRLKKGKELRKADDLKEVEQNMHIIRAPAGRYLPALCFCFALSFFLSNLKFQ